MSQFADSTSFVKLVAKLQVKLWFRARIDACIFFISFRSTTRPRSLFPQLFLPMAPCRPSSLFSRSSFRRPPSSLLSASKSNYNLASVALTIPTRYFNEAAGASYIQKLCVPEYATCLTDVESKYYSLATTAALIKYIEFIQGVFYAVHSLKFVFQGPEKTMMIGR